MKHIFKLFTIITITCLALISCDKNDKEDIIPTINISFEQNIVSSNHMTRNGNENNEFLNIIKEQTPNYVYVTLLNTDLNKTFKCKSNETITVPIGNYEISAQNNDATYQYVVGSSGSMYSAPLLKMNKMNYSITQKTTSITLNIYYNCYAVFALIDECKQCYAYYIDKNVSFYKKGKYYIAYFTYDGVNIKLTPYDDSNEFISTYYIFTTTYDVNKVFAEYGKYYIIHPQKVDKTTTNFQINITDMEQGNI